MKVLLVGAGGQVGRELARAVPPKCRLVAFDRQHLDITDRQAVAAAIDELRPEMVINAAAYTAVDRAESEPEQAFAVNCAGAGHLAETAAAAGARLIHISTDFVYNGQKSSPYLETDPTGPLNVYGDSKLAGEVRVHEFSRGTALIVRTGWLYSAYGNNFVKTMLRLLVERTSLRVVADQIGTPTWASSLAQALWAAAGLPELRGIYHFSDAGVAGWYDFAVAIQEESLSLGLLQREIPVHPIGAQEYPTPARRPAYSVLNNSAARRDFSGESQHWRRSLRQMLTQAEKIW